MFWEALKNTLIFIGASPIAIALALGIALLVNCDLKGATVYRTIVFLSYPLMAVAVGIIWRWMYDERGGIINFALRESGLIAKPIPFLQSFDWALPSVIVAEVWQIIGFYMIILLTGLQSIPQHLYEAASHRRRAGLGAVLAHHAADAAARRCSCASWSASSTRSRASTSSTS